MFRVPFLIAIALTIAFGGGIWSTLIALDATIGFGAIKLGSWEAFPQAQTVQADPYAKSHRANAGKLLYASAEGLTFIAAIDEAGDRLTGNCSYRVTGHTPPARFWTLFAAVPGAARRSRNPTCRPRSIPASSCTRAMKTAVSTSRFRQPPIRATGWPFRPPVRSG